MRRIEEMSQVVVVFQGGEDGVGRGYSGSREGYRVNRENLKDIKIL